MWHDDEGDEGAGSGKLPDPSTRHWRHPSELGQQGALPNPAPVAAPISASPSGSPAVWPLVAVGGCLAIAAFGVIGLRTGLSGPDSLQAGSAVTAAPTPTTSRTAAASTGVDAVPSTATASSVRHPSDDRSDAAASGAGDWVATVNPTTSRPTLESTVESSAPALAEGLDTTPSDHLEDSPRTQVGRAPVYGVYPAPGRDEGQLGSFVMIGDSPVTSASSLGDRTTVWLRVGPDWLQAVVTAKDPLTDVAMLALVDEPDGVELPTLVVADEPVAIGAPAMVGYGDPTATTADDEPELEPRSEPDADFRFDGSEITEASSLDANQYEQPSTSSQTAVEGDAGPLTDEAVKAWVDGNDRRGIIYSLTKPLATNSGHVIHDPIRLATAPGPADAGAPLRNQAGEIVGLVAHSSLPQVAAVPIERVIEAVGWLQDIGVGDPSWLGVTVVSHPGGLVVTTIDQSGPATDLAAGDLIIAIDGQAAVHPDSLAFAAREVGPGGVLELIVDRQNRLRTVPVEVGTVPSP